MEKNDFESLPLFGESIAPKGKQTVPPGQTPLAGSPPQGSRAVGSNSGRSGNGRRPGQGQNQPRHNNSGPQNPGIQPAASRGTQNNAARGTQSQRRSGPRPPKAASFAEYEARNPTALGTAFPPDSSISQGAPGPQGNPGAAGKKGTGDSSVPSGNSPRRPFLPLQQGQRPAGQAQQGRQRGAQPPQNQGQGQNRPKGPKKNPLKIIPLGGLNEIGKNLTVFEYGNDIFLVDCGMAFPDSELPGVDIVLPDFTYLEKNADRVRGVVITHGHEDHIGGLAYMLKKINVPVYATRLTIGLIEGKLKEHGLLGKASLNVVQPRHTVKMGCMAVEFIRVNHSIPDACALAIHTPVGVLVHTGDFKVDYTPIEGEIIDLARFGELGNRGVLALLSDSTNSERQGFTASEKTVGHSLEALFDRAEAARKRIIIATFSSNIHRVQQIINCAERCGRKVAVFGRSMINVMSIAIELGYLKVPDGLIIDIDLMNRYPSEKVVLITTGSQGEPMSALTRMAMNDHKKVTITPMDFIIISASPIPGNEKLVTKVINELLRAGAEVIHEDVHVSGHACQEEQKMILALTKPRFFLPVHGEYKHLKKHAETARALGVPEENIVIGTIGDVIETDGVDMKITGTVPSGRLLVDGLGVGDVGSIVLRDRKHLAQDGLIIVVATIEGISGTVLAGPDIVSRGFVYVRESEELMTHAKKILTDTLQHCMDSDTHEWNAIKTKLKDVLSDYIYMKTKRSPMILPVIMEV